MSGGIWRNRLTIWKYSCTVFTCKHIHVRMHVHILIIWYFYQCAHVLIHKHDIFQETAHCSQIQESKFVFRSALEPVDTWHAEIFCDNLALLGRKAWDGTDCPGNGWDCLFLTLGRVGHFALACAAGFPLFVDWLFRIDDFDPARASDLKFYTPPDLLGFLDCQAWIWGATIEGFRHRGLQQVFFPDSSQLHVENCFACQKQPNQGFIIAAGVVMLRHGPSAWFAAHFWGSFPDPHKMLSMFKQGCSMTQPMVLINFRVERNWHFSTVPCKKMTKITRFRSIQYTLLPAW